MKKKQAQRRIDEARGKATEVAGKFLGNDDFDLRMKAQNTAGQMHVAFSEMTKGFKKAAQLK